MMIIKLSRSSTHRILKNQLHDGTILYIPVRILLAGLVLRRVSLLIENVLGFEILGNKNIIRWTLKRNDTFGIKNIQLEKQKVSLICEPLDTKQKIIVKCEKPFELEVIKENEKHKFKILNKEEVFIF